VCDRLFELRRAIGRYAAHFDPNVVSCADAARVVKQTAEIEAVVRTIQSLAAARLSEGDSWKTKGHRSAAEALARETGTSIGAAKDVIETGRRLGSRPDLSDAACSGELSFAQTSLIANASEADPRAEKRLVGHASRLSLSELKSAVAKTKADADPDPEARRRRIHARRYLRSWTDIEGTWHLNAAGNPEDGAQIMSAIGSISESIFRAARTEGRREPPDAYSFDALLSLSKQASKVARLATKPSSSTASTVRCHEGAPVKILVRIDYDSFLRGVPRSGETCEMVGFGPVSVSAVNDLIRMGDPFVAAILTKGKSLIGAAHLGRKPTALQKSALEWLYPSCAAEGCHDQVRLEYDHRIDWAKTHFTMLDLLDSLCRRHHRMKTNEGWGLVEGSGKRAFVPHDDPRHPRHRVKRE